MTSHSKADILIVDDTPANLQVLAAMLFERDYNVRPVTNGLMALTAARASRPDLVLLDINMPDMDGYEVCQHFKADPELADIPIIFISASDQTADKVKAFYMGGVDYVTKPFHVDEVLARVDVQLNLYWHKQEIERLLARDQLYVQKLTRFMNDLMSTASHDLRNPLTGIRMTLHLLSRHGSVTDDRGQKYLESIRLYADQMLNLITELLDVAKIDIRIEPDEWPPE